jgi:hypothetical protein
VALLALGGRHSNPRFLYLWLFHRGESLSSRVSPVINQIAVSFTWATNPLTVQSATPFPRKKLGKEIKGKLWGFAMDFFTNLGERVTNGFGRSGDP